MLRNNSIDLGKVYREKVAPGLSGHENQAMEKAVRSLPIKLLFTELPGKVHWYILNAPASLRGKCFGASRTRQEAEKEIASVLGLSGADMAVFA